MVFSSPVFLFLFLPLVLLATSLAGGLKAKNTVLLAVSLLFYAWGEGVYVLLMLFTVLVNYLCGLAVDRSPDRRPWLVLAVVLNLGALAWFKYANFLVDSVNVLLSGSGVPLLHLAPVHLPIGVSFFIFQGLSYVIDVFRRQAVVQTRPGAVALYIALFPQLIAGPIVRYHDVAAQIQDRDVDVTRFASGVRRFIIGLAKKLLLADTLAQVADIVFDIPTASLPMSVAWLGTMAYALQLYFDFSGYSDMAIGLGRMFGFEFMENFNFPYIARSIREFWSRWHISLSTWFRDYLYIPLGGNRIGPGRTYLNLFIVFMLTGLWHGASWNFIVWGLFHGVFMVLERLGLGTVLNRLPRFVGIAYTLLVVTLGWVFFRHEDLTAGWHHILCLFGNGPAPSPLYHASFYLTNDVVVAFVIGALAATPLWRTGLAWGRSRFPNGLPAGLRSGWSMLDVSVHAALFLLCAMHLSSSTFTPFLYFRF